MSPASVLNFFLLSPARIRLEWALGTGQQVSTHALATSRPPSLPRGGLGEGSKGARGQNISFNLP
jgi:hypothetical protein